MIDTWFKNDLQGIFTNHPVAVFVDESGDAEFLLETVKDWCTVYHVNSKVEELHVKYLIEKAQPTSEKFLVYTRKKEEELTFVREYCETNGHLNISKLQNYIKKKVSENLNLNINLSEEELVAAAKVGIGKDNSYWEDLSHKGASEIFNLEKELLSFIHDPSAYEREKYDAQIRETFYRKVNELLEQNYLSKPVDTLAAEVVKVMLDGLAENSCNKTLEAVYNGWLDSITFRDSFSQYLSGYTLPKDMNIWNVSIHHPFRKVDEKWLAETGKHISDKTFVSNTLEKLHQRNQSKQAQALGIVFWISVIDLLEFDPEDIRYLSTFDECIAFYTKHFHKLDTAIRNLYAEFLDRRDLLEPFQELYKEHVSVFLDKWFEYWEDYKETQTGTLQRIIDENRSVKTAVIVGDGVAYEMAEQVANRVKNIMKSRQYVLKQDSILADIPSETENNMSRIYLDNRITEAVHSKREKYLAERNPDVVIEFIQLGRVNGDLLMGEFLVCTYKDIDSMGEKLQQEALKYFPATIEFFANKISLLLACGYDRVYLITDHGFVLTGLLSEADKISITPAGDFYKAERYIRTVSRQTDLTPAMIEAERSYKKFEYLYFSKNINPFKTPGVYGFSHGGLSPQELITPFFCWERSRDSDIHLSVTIRNKADLSNVTGDLFPIKIQADDGAQDLFSAERKVYLMFFAGKAQISTSDVFSIQRNESITRDYRFEGHTEIVVHLLDATTKQQLDKVVVKQNNDRDLSGLI